MLAFKSQKEETELAKTIEKVANEVGGSAEGGIMEAERGVFQNEGSEQTLLNGSNMVRRMSMDLASSRLMVAVAKAFSVLWWGQKMTESK